MHRMKILLKPFESVSTVAVAAALLVAGLALVMPGVEKAHATTGTFTFTANGSASPPVPCPTNGDFTITNNAGPCGDGNDEVTRWTFYQDDNGNRLDPSFCRDSGEVLATASLTLTLTPGSGNPLFIGPPADTVSVGVLSIAVTDGGWFPPFQSNPPRSLQTAVKGLMAGPGVNYTSNQILAQLIGFTISMTYQDDAIVSSAQLTLTCERPVGGVTELQASGADSAGSAAQYDNSGGPVGDYVLIAGSAAAAAVALALAAWHTRRSWTR